MCNYAEENKYELLSKFKSLKEFNDHFEQTMLLHKDKFTKSEHLALNKLRKFAADIFGVAWCRIQKAVSATHKDEMFGVSRSTFERMLRKAKKLNLVRVINQEKENKYKKHNVYVFNRVDELTPEKFETVKIVSNSHTIDVSESMKIDATRTLLLELPKLKDYKTYSQAKSVAPKDKSNIIDFKENKTEYQQIDEMILDMFTDKKITYRVYGVWLAAKKKYDLIEPPFELAIKAVKLLIAEMKKRIAKNLPALYNPVGYFNGIVCNLVDQWNDRNLEGYEQDWEAAMIEDGSAFVTYEDHSNDVEEDIFTPLMKVSYGRYSYFTQYIQLKKREISFAGVELDRYLNRMNRLIRFEKLLDRCHVVNPRYDWLNTVNENIDFEEKQAEFHARLAELQCNV